MRVLVTGGAGYVGSVLCARLLKQGHKVRIFDRFAFGRDSVAHLAAQEACEVVEGDIRRLQDAPGLLDEIEAVVHLAALTNDPSCDLDAEMAWDVNVEAARELAKEALSAGVRRFILGSTCSVYGHGAFDLLDEGSPPNPVSTYGRTKLAAEEGLLGLRGRYFEPVVARGGTCYGVSPRIRFDLAVNQMTATAVRQGRIVVRGGGNQWRPFLHVEDAARAFDALLEAPSEAVSGEIFNVGHSHCQYRIAALADLVARAIPGTALEEAKDDDDLRSFRVSFSKFEERFGFEQSHPMEEGIDTVRKWLKDHTEEPFGQKYFNVARMKALLATPVDEGGEPVAHRFVHLARASLGPEEEQAVLEALRSGWLTSGPRLQEFERAFAGMVEAPHALGVTSCTAALHLSLVEAGVKPGDEVITSPITWASTGNTILNMGAKVRLVDVDPRTLNLNPALLDAAITERTRAIMPVHLAGQPCDLDAIREVAARHDVPVVEDAAHALGASYKGIPVGAYSPYTCFSFYAIKNITTMEGGMVTLKDPEKARHMRFLATNGMSSTAWERYGRSTAAGQAEVVEPGFKYLLGNVNAAMGVEQLKKFPDFKRTRKRLAGLYLQALREIDEIRLPEELPDREHAWHLFMIRFRLDKLSKSRDELQQALRMENIGSGVHFYGLHLHRYYREALGTTPEMLPEATAASSEILSLPLHPQLIDWDISAVVAALKKVLHHARPAQMAVTPEAKRPLL